MHWINLIKVRRKILRHLHGLLYTGRQSLCIFRDHIRPTDVFLVGHPKSGNTWLAYMLAIILQKDWKNYVTLVNLKNLVPPIHGEDSHIALYSHLHSPRVFRNEWPIYQNLYPKTIYLIRDPRSVLVSYYHYYQTIINDSQTTLESFVKEYLSCGCIRHFEAPLLRWDSQVQEWMQRARWQSVMLVRYEDMIQDRRHVLEKVIEFCQIPCTEDEIDLAIERGSFEAMRRVEQQHGTESYAGKIGQRGPFIRRGKVDGWKDELPAASKEALESELGPVMKAIGYL